MFQGNRVAQAAGKLIFRVDAEFSTTGGAFA